MVTALIPLDQYQPRRIPLFSITLSTGCKVDFYSNQLDESFTDFLEFILEQHIGTPENYQNNSEKALSQLKKGLALDLRGLRRDHLLNIAWLAIYEHCRQLIRETLEAKQRTGNSF